MVAPCRLKPRRAGGPGGPGRATPPTSRPPGLWQGRDRLLLSLLTRAGRWGGGRRPAGVVAPPDPRCLGVRRSSTRAGGSVGTVGSAVQLAWTRAAAGTQEPPTGIVARRERHRPLLSLLTRGGRPAASCGQRLHHPGKWSPSRSPSPGGGRESRPRPSHPTGRLLTVDPRRHRMADKAAQQHGLLSAPQLRELGFSDHQRRHLIAIGALRPLRRSVYAMAGAPQSWRQTALAAVLAAGPDTVLSHAEPRLRSGSSNTTSGLGRPPRGSTSRSAVVCTSRASATTAATCPTTQGGSIRACR